MKSVFRTVLITVLALVLTTLGWVGAIALGWLPVPAFVTDQVAHARGLSPSEAQALHRSVNLYATLRQSPDAPVLDRAVQMVTQGVQDDGAWMSFAREVYPQLSPETLERVRVQLEIEQPDFDAAKTVLEQILNAADGPAIPELTRQQVDVLTAFDAKYHLVETFAKFQ